MLLKRSSDSDAENEWIGNLNTSNRSRQYAGGSRSNSKLIPQSFGPSARSSLRRFESIHHNNRILSSNFHGYLSHIPGIIHERTIKGFIRWRPGSVHWRRFGWWLRFPLRSV